MDVKADFFDHSGPAEDQTKKKAGEHIKFLFGNPYSQLSLDEAQPLWDSYGKAGATIAESQRAYRHIQEAYRWMTKDRQFDILYVKQLLRKLGGIDDEVLSLICDFGNPFDFANDRRFLLSDALARFDRIRHEAEKIDSLDGGDVRRHQITPPEAP